MEIVAFIIGMFFGAVIAVFVLAAIIKNKNTQCDGSDEERF